MESKQAKQLASRLVAGERLTQSEQRELLTWLQQHPEDRDAYLADEAVDSLLGCLARLRSTEDEFVAATLRRVAALSEHARGKRADGSAADKARAMPAAGHGRKAPNEFSERWSIMVQASARWSAGGSGSAGGSVTTGSHGRARGGSQRSVSVSENGRSISISQDNSGITVTTVEMVDGKEGKAVVKAADAQELERKSPAAFRLYKQHLDGAADTAGPGQSGLPWPSDARGMLREQLRQQLRDSADNPQMRELLEKMLRQFDEDE